MTTCAVYAGRDIATCTRGMEGCVCLKDNRDSRTLERDLAAANAALARSQTAEADVAGLQNKLEQANEQIEALIEEGAAMVADIEGYKRQLTSMQRIVERQEAEAERNRKDAGRYRITQNCLDFWVHIDAPSGLKASFNLGHKKAGTIFSRVLEECAAIGSAKEQSNPITLTAPHGGEGGR